MIEFEVKGYQELLQVLRNVPDKIGAKAVSAGVYEGCKVVRDEARRDAPKREKEYNERQQYKYGKKRGGTLRKGIVIGRNRKMKHYRSSLTYAMGQNIVAWAVGLTKRAFYGKFIEKGWMSRGGRHIPARPFLLPALNRNAHSIASIIRDKIRMQIESGGFK